MQAEVKPECIELGVPAGRDQERPCVRRVCGLCSGGRGAPSAGPRGETLNTYGVRPRETCTFRDQLGLVPGTKSKIADRSDMGALWRHVTTVGDS